MIKKPKSCEGCPAYNWGAHYVPDETNPEARVIILAQNPGESEEKGRRFLSWSGAGGEKWEATAPAPLIGKSGYDLTNHYLPLSGLQRDNVRCGNVVRCRWKNSNVLPPLTQSGVREIIRHCQQAHFTPPREGQVVVALGAYALWAVTGEFGAEGADEDDDSRASRSIDGWRGWCMPYKPQKTTLQDQGNSSLGRYTDGVTVLATYHPAFFYRAHWLKPVGKMDWAKLGRLLKGTWPEPTPHIERSVPDAWPDSLAFDTEYNPATGELHRYSVAWRRDDGVPVVHVVEARDVRRGGPPPRVVIQHNAEADWPYLASVFGQEDISWDDTMYAHSALYGTLRHTLDFLGSLYARTNRWKHLEQSDPIVYSGLDALATWDAWAALAPELGRDPGSRSVYEQELKPLLPHLLRRPSIQLDAVKVAHAVTDLSGQQVVLAEQAQVTAGWPLNVGSPDQVARWIGVKG